MENVYKIISLLDPKTSYAESFRKLQITLQFAMPDENKKVVQLVSSSAGEGKSLSCMNLACAYAEKGKKVLLVDLDFRKPKVHRGFSLVNENGITDLVAGTIKLEQAIKKTIHEIDIIPRGSAVPNPEIVLESPLLINTIKELKNLYDVIILDCPPVLAVTDALIISKYSDAVVFLVAYKQTKKDEAKNALRLLKEVNANVVGVLMTKVNFKYINIGGYYYSKYYSYQE